MYLDHNAGGRVRPEVAEAVVAWLSRASANPSSVHAAGRATRAVVETAREDVAALIGVQAREVVFTSGGTEANNLAVLGSLRPGDHAVTTAIEHASVLRPLAVAESRGCAVTRLDPNRDGNVDVDAVVAALHPRAEGDASVERTRLVSIGWANGEIGTVQAIAEIATAVHRCDPDVWVHSDAVQAAPWLAVDARAAGVDLLSISGHKLGALAGIGALAVRRAGIAPLLHGGEQERERRAGTENVIGIVSFGVAARLASAERASVCARVRALRERLWSTLASHGQPVVRLSPAEGLPGTLLVSFPGLRSDALVIGLDLVGVAASAGSACAAGAAEPSPAVRALGLSPEVAAGALRLSLGAELADGDVDRAAAEIVRAVARARAARIAPGRQVHHAA